MHNTAATGVPKSCQKDRLKACEINRLLAASPNAPAMGGRTMKNFLDKAAMFCTKMSRRENISYSGIWLFSDQRLLFTESICWFELGRARSYNPMHVGLL